MKEISKRTKLVSLIAICAGQLVSLFGTSMTQFALGIWVFEKTGAAMAFATVGFLYTGMIVISSPIAGMFVDKLNLRVSLIISDLMAGLSIIPIAIFLSIGVLEVWHLYIVAIISGFFGSFQWLAFSVTIPLLVGKKNLTRANSAFGLVEALTGITAPLAAAFLMAYSRGIETILSIDIITFVFAIITLIVIYVPKHLKDAVKDGGQSIIDKLTFGFRYIFRKKELFSLQSLVAISNLLGGFVDALLIPMILLYTGQDTTITGLLVSVMGIGALIGGIFVSIHGGPKKLIFGVLGGLLPILLGQILLGIGSETTVWIIGALLLTLFHPMVSSSLQTIWQLSVDKNLQGKVFGARRLISGIAGPFGMLIASSLADNVFEPAMQGENFLSNSFKWLVDDVPGSGMSILLIISGLIGALIIIWGFTSKKLKTLNKKLETKMKSEKDAAPVSG